MLVIMRILRIMNLHSNYDDSKNMILFSHVCGKYSIVHAARL